MKVLQVNIFGNLSTGKIATDIARTLEEQGDECVVAYARNGVPPEIHGLKIGNQTDVYVHGALTRVTDRAGFYSTSATKKFLKRVRELKPDIIHLHNLHGYYLNVKLLFEFLKEAQIPVVWTLHDCWSFTGHCCNFEAVGCNRWQKGCFQCPQKRSYPASYVLEQSKKNYCEKKELFTGLENMTLVVPSDWLRGLLAQSYMAQYPVKLIRNGIDTRIFTPTYGTWKEKYNIGNKKIVLGVAGTWTPTKGLDDIVRLAKNLDSSYQVVVVGVSAEQKKRLPREIIGIERTYDNRELAEIYTAAYCFINPTYDDNFPTVNLEALACGTPVVMYRTGGGPEILDSRCGRVVERGNLAALQWEIENLKLDAADCRRTASVFDRTISFQKYIDLYHTVWKQ